MELSNSIQPPNKVAVAWSGGADSTALLLLLKEKGHDVQAWHVDHGWHHESSQIAAYLADQAESWNIEFHMMVTNKPSKNLEAEARKGRYACFEQLSKKLDCFDLCLGHQADDQAETVFMRMLQGSGVSGCRGMQTQRMHGPLKIWRPLLDVTRADIEAFLRQRKVNWVQDPSNRDISLWRNKIRCKVFPEFEDNGVNPLVLFSRWQKVAVLIQQKIELGAQGVDVSLDEENNHRVSVIDWRVWREQSAPVRAFLLQKMVSLIFADGVVFGRRHILAIEQWREHGGNGWLNLSGCCLYRKGQDLQLSLGKMSLRDGS